TCPSTKPTRTSPPTLAATNSAGQNFSSKQPPGGASLHPAFVYLPDPSPPCGSSERSQEPDLPVIVGGGLYERTTPSQSSVVSRRRGGRGLCHPQTSRRVYGRTRVSQPTRWASPILVALTSM